MSKWSEAFNNLPNEIRLIGAMYQGSKRPYKEFRRLD